MAVRFDTVGAGAQSATGSASWAHTISASANAAVTIYQPNTTTTPTVSAKIGATSMVQLGTITYTTTTFLYIFGLLDPPTGAQTNTATETGGGTSACSANSFSYFGVGSFGTFTSTSGTGTAMTQTVSAAIDALIFQAFGARVTGDITAYNKTSRWNIATVSSVGLTTQAGDSVAGQAVGFSATTPTGLWGGVAVPLIPIRSPAGMGNVPVIRSSIR